MNPVQEAEAALGGLQPDDPVREDHAFLDQLVRVALAAAIDLQRLAPGPQRDPGLRDVELERALAAALLFQLGSDLPQAGQELLQLR